MATKPTRDGNPAKGDVQNFKASNAQCIVYEKDTPMPMHNPMGLKMAMNNTFHGMPNCPNTYVFEGMTQEPMRPGEMRNREEK